MTTWYWENSEADGKWYPAANDNFDDSAGGGGTDGTPVAADTAMLLGSLSSDDCLIDARVPSTGELASCGTSAYTGTLTISAIVDTADWLPCQAILAGASNVTISGRCEITESTDVGTYSGTWILNGTGAQNFGSNGGGAQEYPTVQIAKPSGAVTIGTLAGGDSITCGNFSLTAGDFDVNGHSLTVLVLTVSSGTCDLSSGAVSCSDLTMSGGSLTNTGLLSPSGDVAISGGALSSFNGTLSLIIGAHDLEIDPDTSAVSGTLDLGSNTLLTSTAIIDGAGFTVTADGAVIRGACIIMDVSASVSLYAPNGTDGLNNTNVYFTEPPGAVVRHPQHPTHPTHPTHGSP